MFSGIVEAVGTIETVRRAGTSFGIRVSAPFRDLEIGESAAVSGVCLTVTATDGGAFQADVSPETLRKSTLASLAAGDRVNLERSLRVGDRLSGHLVFGHVDGIGRLVSIRPEGDSALYRFEAPLEVSRYLVEKGSVAVDGVSLTVFDCDRSSFAVAVIPHTARVTTLGALEPGAAVNLESDMIARYVDKLLVRPA